MDKIVITGGRRLSGTVRVSGAKNAALPLLAASLLAPGRNVYHNVPRLGDLRTMAKCLAIMGADVDLQWPDVVVDTTDIVSTVAPYELMKTMRAAILVLGPLVARFGTATVSLPGGCAIGARPIDLHLMGLEAMGARVAIKGGYVEVTCPRLQGAHIHFPQPTVGGTENLLMAASLADGVTTLDNAACEPEIVDLAQLLNKMGARIKGAGTPFVTIEGVDALHPTEHVVIPDRIETGTLMIAAAITHGDVVLDGICPEHLTVIIEKLRLAGVKVDLTGDSVRVRSTGTLHPLDIITQPHPGFPTDMQAQFMVLALAAQGQSIITESIFENRFMHVPELMRMGADISIRGRTAIIRGPADLSGATVMATDLRASASLILAGLIAQGDTDVLRVYHLDRGYEQIEKKLQALGAAVVRVSSEQY
ncbi:MAG: UDP-N-acetylglucosamine 1-carboxyvinyltransferase [Deltaproteobacteria bacterium HGW-Deltaproteobacteria-17]|nr:MAG: UDP-N-acetylglucosamine 1-carboxyvinyltransferase [Deltaproteobacteria bacterium HGW-Deltaproteobacteria-17]